MDTDREYPIGVPYCRHTYRCVHESAVDDTPRNLILWVQSVTIAVGITDEALCVRAPLLPLGHVGYPYSWYFLYVYSNMQSRFPCNTDNRIYKYQAPIGPYQSMGASNQT